MRIDDGLGKGYIAGVTPSNRLKTDAKSLPEISVHADQGRVFWFATGFISLTDTGSFHGMLYIKNESTSRNLYLDFMRTSGSTSWQGVLYKNPTTGTLITSGTDKTAINMKFDSGNDFVGTFKEGAEGLTVTDGDIFTSWEGTHTEIGLDGSLIITPNTAIAMALKPDASGTFEFATIGWQTSPGAS